MDEHISVQKTAEFDIGSLLRVVWGHKYLVIFIAIAAGLVAVFLAVHTPNTYRAEAVITEVDEGPTGGGLGSQLGGLASMAGINVTTGSNNSRSAQAILKSRHLLEEFVKQNNLVPELFRDSDKKPTLWLAVKRFQDRVLKITDNTRQGKTTLAVEWTDPVTAARWANGLVALANELIRARALDDSTRNVAYLREQINKTTVIEMQRILYNLVEHETKTLMLANERREYAFTVVDPAVPSEIRSGPHRSLMVLVGLAIGMFFGIVTALAIDRMRRLRRA